MIKLILTDMDGTLLNSRHQIPQGITEAVRALQMQGIRFGIATGREYNNVREYFPELAEEIILITDNGTLIYDGKEQIFSEILSASEVEKIVSLVRGISGAWIVLCGKGVGFVECQKEQQQQIAEIAHNFYHNVELTEDVCLRTKEEEIMQISLFCGGRAEELFKKLEQLEKDYQIFVSGSDWIDILSKAAGKGNAVKLLQARYGWKPEECMAFGDYFNDLEMLKNVGESYAMANGIPLLREMAKYIAPSNEEGGVLKVLRERFALDLC